MNTDEALQVARPCVRNELNRCEQTILMIEKAAPGAPGHLNPAGYLKALNAEADKLRIALDYIDGYLGSTPSGLEKQ